MPTHSPKPFDRFDLDLARAVLEQLIERFETLDVGPLDAATINQVFAEQGVYQLFQAKRLVYAGKTSKVLPRRLLRHLRLLSGRKNINLADLGFKAVVINRNWMPSIHEGMVINHYTRLGLCEWNQTGFGNNDPGRNREDTIKNKFDLDFPINERFVCSCIDPRDWNALELLVKLKKKLPFLFRYQCDPRKRYTKGSIKYNSLTIKVPQSSLSLSDLIRVVIDQFPDGWQTTFFPSHVILYAEAPTRIYTNATLVIRKP
ncbi:MAG: Eco29kI family restriction endonuclease [Gemmataceae bacterium]